LTKDLDVNLGYRINHLECESVSAIENWITRLGDGATTETDYDVADADDDGLTDGQETHGITYYLNPGLGEY